MKKRGFTLIELMIVVAIIGILAAIAIPDFLKFQAKARQSEAKTNLASIATSEIAYFAEHNNWGTTFNRIGWAPQGAAKYKYTLLTQAIAVYCAPPTGLDADCFWGDTLCNNGTAGCTAACPDTATDGAQGVDPVTGFTALAKGNVDSDTTLDCWWINREKTPHNSQNDVNLD